MTVVERYLDESKWTRPGKLRENTKAIVIHWTGNAQQRAQGVIDYWNFRRDSYGSAHAVIDLDGTVYLTLPWDEIGYHVGSTRGYSDLSARLFGAAAVSAKSSPNQHTVGVELCHTNWEGEFTPETLASAVHQVAALCRTYNLNPFREVITHQMVVGWKECPRWFVDHPEDFEEFRWSVMDAM